VQTLFDVAILALVIWIVVVQSRAIRQTMLLANANALYIRAIQAEMLPVMEAVSDPEIRAEILRVAQALSEAKRNGLLTPGEWRKVGDDTRAIIIGGGDG
jgi:hypothetical protein